MKINNLWGRIVTVAALLLLVASGTALAQLQTGNLYGTVTDDKGAPLPGVTVTTTGNGAPQVQVTNAQGQFRFLGLTPASYQLKAELEGFSTIDYPNIVINIGRNTQIEVKLSAAVEDVITVTAESPLLDERRISSGATVSQTELEKIPTSRDPWSVLQTAPGVLTDRINVGGNESGQQSQYVGPGSGGDQAVWSVDGVVITDMDVKTAGAYHNSDLPFWYGTLDSLNLFRRTRDWTPYDYRLSNQMQDVIVAFARTGNPVTVEAKIPLYNPKHEQRLIFGDDGRFRGREAAAFHPFHFELPWE